MGVRLRGPGLGFSNSWDPLCENPHVGRRSRSDHIPPPLPGSLPPTTSTTTDAVTLSKSRPLPHHPGPQFPSVKGPEELSLPCLPWGQGKMSQGTLACWSQGRCLDKQTEVTREARTGVAGTLCQDPEGQTQGHRGAGPSPAPGTRPTSPFLCFSGPYWPPPPSSWKGTCGPRNVTPRTHVGLSHPPPDTPIPGPQAALLSLTPSSETRNRCGSCILTPASNLEVLLFRTAQTEVVVFEADHFSLLPPSISKMPDISKQILWNKSRKWSSELRGENRE